MSDRPTRVDDADLHALVDGALEPARRAEVEAAVASDDELKAKVEGYRELNRLLREAYDPVLGEVIPEALLNLRVRRATRRWIAPAAAAVLALAVGLGGGWLVGSGTVMAPVPQTGAEVASDGISAHRVYTGEVRHPVEVAAAEEAHLVKWLSKRLANPLKAPYLGEQGYRLVGGRLLPAAAGRPAAQFMYEAKSGERITIYIRQNTTDQQAAFRFVDADGLSAMYWLDPNLAYAIVAELPRDELMQLSKLIYSQLETR